MSPPFLLCSKLKNQWFPKRKTIGSRNENHRLRERKTEGSEKENLSISIRIRISIRIEKRKYKEKSPRPRKQKTGELGSGSYGNLSEFPTGSTIHKTGGNIYKKENFCYLVYKTGAKGNATPPKDRRTGKNGTFKIMARSSGHRGCQS